MLPTAKVGLLLTMAATSAIAAPDDAAIENTFVKPWVDESGAVSTSCRPRMDQSGDEGVLRLRLAGGAGFRRQRPLSHRQDPRKTSVIRCSPTMKWTSISRFPCPHAHGFAFFRQQRVEGEERRREAIHLLTAWN